MKYLKEEKILFLFLSGIVFLLLLSGILWKFYPTGVGAIRFILPFAILTGIFCGVILFKRFGEKKIILFILILLLILSLYLNYKMINENYEKFSYNSDEDRYGLIDYLYESKEFPVLNNFTNYRFGTTRYIFSETLNYKFPWASQTWGYFDQGNLYPEELLNFKKTIWGSENITSTKKYFGDYGIKYLEIGGADLKFEKKFSESEDFSLILERNFSDYPFKIFEYKKAKPIISVIKNDEYENISKFMVKRTNPDNIIITYNFSGNEKILFKESYHKSWGAKDMSTNQKIKILKSDKGFMVIEPKANSKEILIYQKKTNLQIAGLIISIIILFLILRYTLKR